MPHRTEFKLAELIYRCLHSLAPSYLADGFHCVADVNYSRRCLWSVLMAALFVPQSSYHCWWPCVPCGCHANMEQFTARRRVVAVMSTFKRQLQTVLFVARSYSRSFACAWQFYFAVTRVCFVFLCGALAVFWLYATIISSFMMLTICNEYRTTNDCS